MRTLIYEGFGGFYSSVEPTFLLSWERTFPYKEDPQESTYFLGILSI